jgi:nucleotide-binding universal stress UspA family protein
MLTIDERKIADPGTGAPSADGSSPFRRILVPVSAPDESCPALAVAARICALGNGVLRLVHVRICDPPLPIAGRFYPETAGEAAAVLEEALLMAWACGGPRATTAVVDARRSDVAAAIAWQAAAWPADLIVLIRRPRLAIIRLVGGSVPDQVMRNASCPVLAVPPGQSDRVRRAVHRRRPPGPPTPPPPTVEPAPTARSHSAQHTPRSP